MADMTQPEMPERASIPDNESQPSEDIVEPTHIGVARHREARESFNPLAPQTPDTGPTAPTGPADRSSIESLRREAERLASRSQPAEAPSIPLGEPLKPRKEGGMPLKAKIGAAAGALAVAAGGFLGFNKIRSGDGDERPGVIITDPTLKPTEPAPTIVPTNTPEAPTSTPTPEVEKYPREMGTSYKFGNTTFDLTKVIQERGVDYNGELIKVNEVYLNTEDYPDAEQRLNEGIMYGQYLAWQTETEGRADVTFEDFKKRVEAGEDMSYTIKGFIGNSAIEYDNIKVDPSKPVHIVLLDGPSPAITVTGGYKRGFRLVEGELYIELFDQRAFEINDKSDLKHYTYNLAFSIEEALALMSNREAQEKRSVSFENFEQNHLAKVYAFDAYFIPIKTNTFWNSILRVK